jgi:hypothetical protein
MVFEPWYSWAERILTHSYFVCCLTWFISLFCRHWKIAPSSTPLLKPKPHFFIFVLCFPLPFKAPRSIRKSLALFQNPLLPFYYDHHHLLMAHINILMGPFASISICSDSLLYGISQLSFYEVIFEVKFFYSPAWTSNSYEHLKFKLLCMIFLSQHSLTPVYLWDLENFPLCQPTFPWKQSH